MVIISNQILIEFLRQNNRADNVRNDQLGKMLDKIIIELGGEQQQRVFARRDNEEGDQFKHPKSSRSYTFPKEQIQNLFDKILDEF
ncbi:MAG: hypothetical protein M0R38_10635 [Bacteroidia bacterium]|nr:hypothetical protein [Bacteroidia bacterium]